jgi:HAD superfamily hydrolase (TIGR01490 family)
MTKKHVAAFDFDGTITRRDTLIEFIRFACGNVRFLSGFLLYSPLLVAFKLGLYPNWKAKQRIFTHFFGGMDNARFRRLCEDFYQQRGQSLIYHEAQECIREHLAAGDEVVIISASAEDWVKPFAQILGVSHLLATQLELTDDGCRLTGRFASANCYGAEKVERLRSLFPRRDEILLTAYGDSRGDKELLAYADTAHLKPFRH